MYLLHLTSRIGKITKHKSHLQSSVSCLNQTKITHSTGNDLFYCQSRWILILSINKNVTKDKSLNVPATLDIARYALPWKITRHKSKHQSSVFDINQTKLNRTSQDAMFVKVWINMKSCYDFMFFSTVCSLFKGFKCVIQILFDPTK